MREGTGGLGQCTRCFVSVVSRWCLRCGRRAETRRTYVCFVNYVRALLEDFEAQLDVACARCLLQVFEEVLLVDGNGVRVAWPDVGSREPC